jgi:hypothetical protein
MTGCIIKQEEGLGKAICLALKDFDHAIDLSNALTLRKILEGQGNADEYKELLQNLREFCNSSKWGGNEIQRQLLRLQDLGDGGGLGFVVELFFLALEQLFSTSSSNESLSALYMGTFRAITSDWEANKNSFGIQKLLLDFAWSRRWEFSYVYPIYIIEEFFLLLGNIFEGKTGPHIDEAAQKFESFRVFSTTGGKFRDRMLRVLTGAQAQSS